MAMSAIDCYFTPELKSGLLKWVRVFQCFLFSLLVSPIFIFIAVVTLVCRILVTIHFKVVHEGKFTLCSPPDAAFAFETHANCIAVNTFTFVKGRTDVYKLQDVMLNKFIGYKSEDGRQPYQKFTWKLLKKYGFFTWETCNDSFDIRDHVRICPGMDSNTVYTEQEVLQAVAKRLDDMMNPKRPQWELLYVPNVRMCKNDDNNSEDLHYAFVFRCQHSYADGISAIQALRHGICDEPTQLIIDPVHPPIPEVSMLQKIGLYVEALFTAPYSYYKMISTTPKSVFQEITENTGPKYMASTTKPIPLESVKVIRNKLKCSTTALFNSVITGALRRAAKRKGLPIPEEIDLAFTMAMLPYQNEDPQNRFILKILQSPISVSDPVKRLNKMNGIMKTVVPSEILALHCLAFAIGHLPVALIALIYRTTRCGCAISNLPAFKYKPQINGDTIEVAYGCPPVKDGLCFGVGVCCLNGNIRTCWMAEKTKIISSTDDMNDLMDDFEKEFSELECIANKDN